MRAMRRIVAGRNVFSWAFWTKSLQYAARRPEDYGVGRPGGSSGHRKKWSPSS